MANSLLDHGADVDKVNDEGITPLSATIALLFDDRVPVVRRPELTPPGQPSPPVSSQAQGPKTAVDPATARVGRLKVNRANHAVVMELLNDSPMAPPTISLDAAGQMYTLEEAKTEKMADARVVEDKPTPSAQQQQLKSPITPASGRGSERPLPLSNKVSSSPGETREEKMTNQVADEKRTPSAQQQQSQQTPKSSVTPASGARSERPSTLSNKVSTSPGKTREEKTVDQKVVVDENRAPETQQQQPPKLHDPPTGAAESGQPSVLWIRVSGTLGETREPKTIDLDFLKEQLMAPSGVPADGEESGQPLALSADVSSTAGETREAKNVDQKVAEDKPHQLMKPQSSSPSGTGSGQPSPVSTKVSQTAVTEDGSPSPTAEYVTNQLTTITG